MRKQNVTFEWDKDFKSAQVTVGEDGVGRVEVPPGAKQFIMLAGPRIGKEPNRVAYRNCNQPASVLISVSDVVGTGVVPKNVCGNQRVAPHPGEIVFWALPKSFWDFQ